MWAPWLSELFDSKPRKHERCRPEHFIHRRQSDPSICDKRYDEWAFSDARDCCGWGLAKGDYYRENIYSVKPREDSRERPMSVFSCSPRL